MTLAIANTDREQFAEASDVSSNFVKLIPEQSVSIPQLSRSYQTSERGLWRHGLGRVIPGGSQPLSLKLQ